MTPQVAEPVNNNLWKGLKKRNPYKKRINQNLADNFNDNRIESYAILCRVSTDMQAKEGESLQSQLDKAKRFVAQNGGHIFDEYIEEGVSVSAHKKKIDERPEMQRLKLDIIEGRVNHILIFKRTRLSRNKRDRDKFLFEFCPEHGCKVTITQNNEEIDIYKKDKMKAITEDLRGHMDEWSSDETSENVTDVMWELAKYHGRIMGGQAPLGYHTVYLGERDEDGKQIPTWRPIEDFQQTKETIEELYLDGFGYGSIARYFNGGEVRGLNQLPVPVDKPTINDSMSKTWNDKNIETVLFNPAYTGYYSYNVYRHEHLYDPVITKSKYITACRTEERQKELNDFKRKKQRVINETKNTKRFSSPHLLSGIVICKHCGQPYEVSGTKSSNPNRKSHHYYRCRNKFANTKERCTGATFNTRILDNFVVERVDRLINNLITSGDYELVEKRLNEKQEDTQLAHNKIAKQVAEKEKDVKDLIFEKMRLDKKDPMYDFTYSIYQEKEKELIAELAELRTALINVENYTEDNKSEQYSLQKILQLFKDYSENFKFGSEQKRKAIIEYLVSDVIVDEKLNVSIVFTFGLEKVKDSGNVIVSENIGEGMIVGHITDSADGNVFTFNYQEEISRVLNKVSNAFYNALCHFQPLFTPEYILSLPESRRTALYDGLLEANAPYSMKAEIASNKILEKTLNIKSASQRRRLQNGMLPTVEKLFEYIEKAGATYEQFQEYVHTRHSGLIHDEESLREILEAGRTKASKKEYILKGLIECCECGRDYVGLNKTGKKVTYRCQHNRSDMKDKRCLTKMISEDEVLEKLNEVLKLEEIRRQDIVWKVEKVIVKKDGTFDIKYKS